jgi:hypothetical protein
VLTVEPRSTGKSHLAQSLSAHCLELEGQPHRAPKQPPLGVVLPSCYWLHYAG